jgi:Concanavalin A-like lectin/glucanases superfamily
MLTRITTLCLILLLAGIAKAQSPTLTSIVPVGPTVTDASVIPFEATFSEPVSAPGFAWGRTGTLSGPAITRVQSKEFLHDIDLPATNDSAEVPSGITLPNSFTVEFWHRYSGGNSATVIFSYADATNDNAIAIFADGRVFLDQNLIATVGAAVANKWAHIALVNDFPSSTATIYIDGDVAATATVSAAIGSGGYLVLGQDQDSFGGGFDPSQAYPGRIDELRIWGVARSQSQIEDNMFEAIEPSAASLLHYWSFDDVADLGVGSAGTNDVADLAGSAHMSLEGGVTHALSDVPSTKYIVTADLIVVLSPGWIVYQPSTNGSIVDTDGNSLVPTTYRNYVGAVYRPCANARAVAQAPTQPSTNRDPQRTLVFDQIVTNVQPSDLNVGGVAPNGATVTATSVGLGNALELPVGPSFPRMNSDAAGTPGIFPNSGPMTFECWFRTNDPTSESRHLMSFGTPASPDAFRLSTFGTLLVDGPSVQVLPGIDLGQRDGGWHHMAITRSGTGLVRRYIDGIPAGERSGMSSPFGSDGYLVIAQEQDSFAGGFDQSQSLDGAVDEIRIWSVERSYSDIVATMGREIDPLTPGLHAYYRCEEFESLTGSGTDDIRDLSPNGFHLDSTTSATFGAVDRASEWKVDLNFPSVTAFVDVDIAAGNGIVGDCGLNAVNDPSGEAAIEHVFVEDMTSSVVINGDDEEFHRASVAGGDQLLFNWESPDGSHDGASILLVVAQFLAAGAEPASNLAFPEVRLALSASPAPFVIYDGATGGPFSPTPLAPGGLSIGAGVPAGLSGNSMVFQALATGSATTLNGFFAASNALVLDF